MAETDDDVIANWHERVGTLRKRGRISGAALAVVPPGEIDVRLGRPAPPEEFSQAEKDLWQRLVESRRPQWFTGAETVLASFVTTTIQCQQIEAQLRKTKASTGAHYQRLARLHRQSVALAATLATRLRLTPHSKLDKNQPTDGELPVG
jgi:hypothetical protein